jgi:hypothetical protein
MSSTTASAAATLEDALAAWREQQRATGRGAESDDPLGADERGGYPEE